MAVYEASKIRAVAIELKEKLFDLYAAILPIYTEAFSWMLNGSDPALPTPFQVRVQLESYDELSKEALRLTDWIASIKQAQPNDYLSYPPPPVLFDGGSFFDGGGTPNP